VCKVVVPEEFQITYRGLCEHGFLMTAETRGVCVSQIVGPQEWEMVYTDTLNPFV
jgi:hypothetical protein